MAERFESAKLAGLHQPRVVRAFAPLDDYASLSLLSLSTPSFQLSDTRNARLATDISISSVTHIFGISDPLLQRCLACRVPRRK